MRDKHDAEITLLWNKSAVFHVAQGIEREHILLHPLVGLYGSDFPAGVAGADNLYEGGALVHHGVLECLADGFLGLAYGGGVLHGLTGHVAGAFELGDELGNLEGITVELGLTSVGSGGCNLSQQGGRGHLTSCHTVDGVVDEYDDDVLSAVAGVHYLGGSDGSEVAVTLICEHVFVGHEPLGGCREGGGTSVGCLLPVDVQVVVCEYGASYGRDTDGLVLDAHFLDDLGYYLVHYAMGAAGAVMEDIVFKYGGFAVNLVLRFDYFVNVHHNCLLLHSFLEDFQDLLGVRNHTALTAVEVYRDASVDYQSDVLDHLSCVELEGEDVLELGYE